MNGAHFGRSVLSIRYLPGIFSNVCISASSLNNIKPINQSKRNGNIHGNTQLMNIKDKLDHILQSRVSCFGVRRAESFMVPRVCMSSRFRWVDLKCNMIYKGLLEIEAVPIQPPAAK